MNLLGLRKVWAVGRYVVVVVVVGLFGILTSWLIYPFAHALRKVKLNPFWFWLDDEIDYDETNLDWREWLISNDLKDGSIQRP